MNMTKTAYALAFAALAPCAFAAEGNMYGNQAQNEGLDVVPAPAKYSVPCGAMQKNGGKP